MKFVFKREFKIVVIYFRIIREGQKEQQNQHQQHSAPKPNSSNMQVAPAQNALWNIPHLCKAYAAAIYGTVVDLSYVCCEKCCALKDAMKSKLPAIGAKAVKGDAKSSKDPTPQARTTLIVPHKPSTSSNEPIVIKTSTPNRRIFEDDSSDQASPDVPMQPPVAPFASEQSSFSAPKQVRHQWTTYFLRKVSFISVYPRLSRYSCARWTSYWFLPSSRATGRRFQVDDNRFLQ